MYNYKNKQRNTEMSNQYTLSKTLSMFNYEGLPDTLPAVELEKQLQVNGYSFITEVEGNLYAFQGGLGGVQDVYGNPTTITISNPALGFNETLDIENDGVLMINDDMKLGLLPVFEKYNTLLTENEITMFINNYNSRIQILMSAGDDSTRESAEQYLKKVIMGELGVIGENRLFEGIKAQTAQASKSDMTTQLIEFHQYIKASLHNEIGINTNYNMKRERLNTSEVKMNEDNIHPFIDNMHSNRLAGVDKLNEKYGLEISVAYGSVWDRTEDEPTYEPADEPETEQLETETEPIDEPIDEPTDEPADEPDEDIKDEIIEQLDDTIEQQADEIDDLEEELMEEKEEEE